MKRLWLFLLRSRDLNSQMETWEIAEWMRVSAGCSSMRTWVLIPSPYDKNLSVPFHCCNLNTEDIKRHEDCLGLLASSLAETTSVLQAQWITPTEGMRQRSSNREYPMAVLGLCIHGQVHNPTQTDACTYILHMYTPYTQKNK